MTWQQLETIFNRSMIGSFSRVKCFLVFLTLALCGLFSVICRAVSIGASQWMVMSLTFLPIFLCSGVLLAVGLVLTRLYQGEIGGEKRPIFEIFRSSKTLFAGIPYLTVPLIFAYLILWMILGVFYLLREIPHIGSALGSIFSFGPFLLVLGSIVLGFLSIFTLFFVTPVAALQNDLKPKLAERVFAKVCKNPFYNLIMLVIGLTGQAACVFLRRRGLIDASWRGHGVRIRDARYSAPVLLGERFFTRVTVLRARRLMGSLHVRLAYRMWKADGDGAEIETFRSEQDAIFFPG